MNITQAQNLSANILIVDDTPDNLDLLSAILNKRGYQTRCVDSGLAAIEIARTGWAELILLDIQMPEIDGYEVCQRLKADERTREIPVIFISALDDFLDKKKAFSVGGVDYITKPFQIKEVVVRIVNQITIQAAKTKIIELNNQLEQKVEERTLELKTANQKLQQEITQRQEAQDRLLRMALYDSVTGLANRNSFVSRLKQALQVAKKQPDYFFAVILLECDRFRAIKRTISHIESNQLLITIGDSITACLPDSSLLSRLEGEEFAIFIDQIQDPKDATTLVEQIQRKLSRPFSLKRRRVLITPYMGIVIGNKDYQKTDRLFNDADIALQKAKTADSESRYQIFQPEMYVQLQTDVEFVNREIELKKALKHQEFVNYYLPIASLITGNIVELETLVRWHHPTDGVLLPKDFIPVAEETGLIIAIGDLIIKKACHQVRLWQQHHPAHKDLNVCLNLSGKQLFHPNLIPKIDLILRKTRLKGRNLKLEIAETAIIENPDLALNVMRKLKQRQIKLSLDNFGVGYSSLTCLHNFPFDNLKIDRSLISKLKPSNDNFDLMSVVSKSTSYVDEGLSFKEVASLEETSSGGAVTGGFLQSLNAPSGDRRVDFIARAPRRLVESQLRASKLVEQAIYIAHQLGMTVTAEGIETEYQLHRLQKLGCDYGEGHLISPLLDRKSVARLISSSVE